jgi:hypothetical protein
MEARGTPECTPIWTWTIGDRDDQLRDGQLNDQSKAGTSLSIHNDPHTGHISSPVLAIHRIGKSFGSGATTRE